MANMSRTIFDGAEVSLPEMLDAREKRVFYQNDFLNRFGCPLVCFTMNIPGPVKFSKVIERAFDEGCRELENILCSKHYPIAGKKTLRLRSGCSGFYSVNTDVLALKKLCIWLEDSHPLGRLFDIDVIDPSAGHISRSELGFDERSCIICGSPGRSCAASRAHSADQLQERVAEILYGYYLEKDSRRICSLAAQSLRYELSTTPKPGLVDLDNTGSHPDMDIYKMLSSISVLAGYYRKFFEIGVETADRPGELGFLRLRQLGLDAEKAMLEATGGVNTHKGAIFLLGLVCGACGRLWTPSGLCADSSEICSRCTEMSAAVLHRELDSLHEGDGLSFGEQLYLEYGISGARGQAIDGFPQLQSIALPTLRRLIAAGSSICNAGAIVLLHLIAEVPDTCLIRRGGLKRREEISREIKQLLRSHPIPSLDMLMDLDRKFTAENLSPGGCADLLAVSYFFYLLEESI